MQKNQNHASPTPNDHLKVTTNFPLNHSTLILNTLHPIITDIVTSFRAYFQLFVHFYRLANRAVFRRFGGGSFSVAGGG